MRPGLAAALSVWWKKLSPDGRNANEVTSQAHADMGGAATFYDCLVEVESMNSQTAGVEPKSAGTLRPFALARQASTDSSNWSRVTGLVR